MRKYQQRKPFMLGKISVNKNVNVSVLMKVIFQGGKETINKVDNVSYV